MEGEGKNQDYKLLFDTSDERAKVKLVKIVVAIANAGGGRIVFGRDETNKPGVEENVTTALDSARFADFVETYIKPAPINIAHDSQKLDNGNYLHSIIVSAAQYPIVMSRQGNWKGMGKNDNPLFAIGDIWTRHSSKTEKVKYEDIRIWLEEARRKGREGILDQIQMVSKLPEGMEIGTVTKSGEPLTSPIGLLEYQAMLRELNPNHLIESYYLNWLFINRNALSPTTNELSILIGSALKRPPTLYWWLIDADEHPELIVREILAVLNSEDRDKSDAANSIVELAAIYAANSDLEAIVKSLAESRYKHFNDEATQWIGREHGLKKIKSRIFNANYNGERLLDQPFSVLQRFADKVANELASSKSSSKSTQLGNITRVMWFKRSTRLH